MSIKSNIDFSIVIPSFMSEKFLYKTISEILSYTNKSKYTYELIIVVDGSPDASWDVAYNISQENNSVKAIKLLKNYGQHTANLCGFRNSLGKYVITMDDDGQNPPSELSKFEKFYNSEFDLIIGKHLIKKHGLIRRIGSNCIGFLNRKIFNIKKDLVLSNYRMIHRDVINRINLDNAPKPYIPGMCLKYSNKQTNINVNHRDRVSGKSNYNLRKLVSLVFELLIQHSYLPLKFVAYIGVLMASFGIFGAVFIVYQWLIGDVGQVEGWRSIITILLISSGMIMSSISMLGLYIIRILENQSTSQYSESKKSWIN